MDEFENLQISERCIIVGIDFGTTFSGVAWAETKRPDRRSHISQWPIDSANSEGKSSEKVPTILHYGQDGTQWGFQINANTPLNERVEWFKLGLNPDSRKDLWNNPSGRDVEVLITDYLTALNKHVMFVLQQKLGASVLRTTPIEYILTVPAIWSDSAKQKTLEACKKAKFKTEKPITLISEPEAAAIYALHGLDPHGLQEGDTFVICDAGGGTVDLISYTVTRLRPILEVEEAGVGSGDMCGSTFLNRLFGTFLMDKLGLEEEWDEEILAEAREHFDAVVKKQFSIRDSPTTTYNIPVPGMSDNFLLGIRRGKFALQNRDLHAIFEPVVSKIIHLVEEQIRDTKREVKAVLLVGGFGSSAYLKDRLRNAVGEKIAVMQPSNAWLAVVNGAVMKGLAQASDDLSLVHVAARTARKHYGIELGMSYDPAIYSSIEHKKYWDPKDEKYRVRAMQWIIKKGDKVPENEPYNTHFYQWRLAELGRLDHINVAIYCDSNSSSAPLERTSNVTKLVTLTADFSQVPIWELDQIYGKDGKLYYEAHAHIEAVYHSASTTYTLIHKGKRYDTVTAEYV